MMIACDRGCFAMVVGLSEMDLDSGRRNVIRSIIKCVHPLAGSLESVPSIPLPLGPESSDPNALMGCDPVTFRFLKAAAVVNHLSLQGPRTRGAITERLVRDILGPQTIHLKANTS